MTGQYLITWKHTQSATMPDTLHLSLTSVLWHYVFWSLSLSFFLSLTKPPSRFLPLINSTGVPSDAFQAPSSFHRLGLGRRPEGYWLNRLKLGVKTELSSLKIKTLFPPRAVGRECQKAARSLWTSEEQKLFYLLNRDTAAFKKQSQAGRENNMFWRAARQNKETE